MQLGTWEDHARGDPEEELHNVIVKFLQQSRQLVFNSSSLVLRATRVLSAVVEIPNAMEHAQNLNLFVAAGFGLHKTVKSLMVVGADPLARIVPETVRFLFPSVTKVYGGASAPETALTLAALEGYDNIVKYISEHLVCTLVSLIWRRTVRTVLHTAARAGHTAIVLLCLRAEANPNGWSPSGVTALHWASRAGHVATVEALLAHSAKSFPDSDSRTPLHLAAENGHLDVVRLLLRHNDDRPTISIHGNTAADLAVLRGH